MDTNVRWVTADVTNPTSVHRALEGVEVVVYLVHSLGHADFAARDRRAASIVARAAEAQHVRQIVYLGGLGDESDDLSDHLQSRRDTEHHLASGSVPVTTIRAGMVVGPGSAAFDTILALVDRLPGMVCPRWVSTPTQPIAITDIVRYIAGVCGNPQAIGQTYDAGGPEVMTYRQMIERIARIRHRHPIIIEVPFLTPRLSSLWLRLVTPVQASVARPLIDGLRNPTIVHDNRLQSLVPFELTSFDTAAQAAITAAQPRDRSERLSVTSFLSCDLGRPASPLAGIRGGARPDRPRRAAGHEVPKRPAERPVRVSSRWRGIGALARPATPVPLGSRDTRRRPRLRPRRPSPTRRRGQPRRSP